MARPAPGAVAQSRKATSKPKLAIAKFHYFSWMSPRFLLDPRRRWGRPAAPSGGNPASRRPPAPQYTRTRRTEPLAATPRGRDARAARPSSSRQISSRRANITVKGARCARVADARAAWLRPVLDLPGPSPRTWQLPGNRRPQVRHAPQSRHNWHHPRSRPRPRPLDTAPLLRRVMWVDRRLPCCQPRSCSSTSTW